MATTDIFDVMSKMQGGHMLDLPPRSFVEANAEVVEYVEGESITIKIPLYEKYNNPVGIVLGGYLPMFFDLSFGPLAYLIAKKPTTSLDINTTFIRPLKQADGPVFIKSSLISKSKSYLILNAEALTDEGKLVATATSRLRILG